MIVEDLKAEGYNNFHTVYCQIEGCKNKITKRCYSQVTGCYVFICSTCYIKYVELKEDE